MKVHLETKRFNIRDIEEYDLDGMFDMDSNPNVHKFLGNSPIKTLEEAKVMINNIRAQYQKYEIGRWAIADKKTNEFIGWTGFKREEKLRPDRTYTDIGYRLREKYWGHGIATETALACLKHGFDQLQFTEIYGCADINHVASSRVLQKIGLRYIEDFQFKDFQLHWYGLKKSEFQKKNIL